MRNKNIIKTNLWNDIIEPEYGLANIGDNSLYQNQLNKQQKNITLIVKQFVVRWFSKELNIEDYDWTNFKRYYSNLYDINTNQINIIGTDGYLFLEDDDTYDTYEYQHINDNNDSFLIYHGKFGQGFVLVKKTNNVLKPLCISNIIDDKSSEYLYFETRPLQFRSEFKQI